MLARFRTRLAHNLVVVGVLVNVALWGMADEAAFQAEPYRLRPRVRPPR